MGLFSSIGNALGLSGGVGNLPYSSQQAELMKMLQDRASGAAPSLAQKQAEQAINSNAQNMNSIIQSQHGINPATRARIAASNMQDAGKDAATMGAQARLSEMNQAAGLLGQQINSGNEMAYNQMNNQMNLRTQLITGLGAAAGTAISDKNEKENISDSSGSARDLLDHLKGKLYEYKDSTNGEGVHVGIMAQDLEKSPLGKSMVINDGGMKKVDFGKGFGAVLAAMTEINDKLKEIEGK
jgi:hypothetical protein